MRRTLMLLAGWTALALLLTPLAWAVWVSFTPDELLRPPLERWSLRWYARFLTDARWTAALLNSFVVGTGATCIALLTGVPAALAVARSSFRGRALFASVILLPICVPPLVLGMGLLPAMHALGLWGTFLALMLAHGLLGMPLVFLTTRASLAGVPVELEQAARGLGASSRMVLVRVSLPLCWPGLLAGAALAFVLSLNEFFLTLFLATPHTETLPRVIWPLLRYSLSPLVAVASTFTLALTVAGCLMQRLLHPRGNR